MKDKVHVHYLEIVTPNVEQLCASYSQTLGVSFSDPVAEMGGARTAPTPEGGMMGIRAPMHDGELPVTRPYYLVDDLDNAVSQAEQSGAEVMVPPMDVPGRGKCAIIMFESIQSGFWQL